MSFNCNFEPIYAYNRGAYMNALEKFQIYRVHNERHSHHFVLNGHLNFKSNPLYDATTNLYT